MAQCKGVYTRSCKCPMFNSLHLRNSEYPPPPHLASKTKPPATLVAGRGYGMDDVDALLDRLCENGGDECDLVDDINDETFGELGAYDGETFALEQPG